MDKTATYANGHGIWFARIAVGVLEPRRVAQRLIREELTSRDENTDPLYWTDLDYLGNEGGFHLYREAHGDPNYGRATAGNGKRIHAIQYTQDRHFTTLCGINVPRQPQPNQDRLEKCQRCFY